MAENESVPAERALLPLWAAVLAAALAAVVMDLAYPSVGAWPLAFPAVILLLLALHGRRFWGSLLVGAVFGLLFFGLMVSWTSRYLGLLPWAALTFVEGVLTALLAVLITLAYRWAPRVLPGTVGRLLVLPTLIAALWVVRELVLGNWPYGGFPWARLGMTQAESPLAPISSWVGVSGLSFLMVLLCAIVIELVRRRAWQRPAHLVVPACLAVLLLATPQFPTVAAGSMTIGAVQGNGPTGYFDTREPFSVVQAQTDASAPLYGQDMDLLVWPEGGLDASPLDNAALARRLTLVSARADAPVLVNAATSRGDKYFNTSILWNEDGDTGLSHDKRHPVPFGEYVPDRAFFNALVPDLIGLIQREYSPGENSPVIDVDGMLVGLAICFDVIYDDVIREGIREGAQVLVFQTNNADFRGTDENEQQLAFARMRAIETGRSIVNISTVGASQVIAADGRTIAALNADEAGAMLEEIELRTGLTAGVVLGPWIQQLLFWGGLGALVLIGLLARRKP